jgi:hypothetical protein
VIISSLFFIEKFIDEICIENSSLNIEHKYIDGDKQSIVIKGRLVEPLKLSIYDRFRLDYDIELKEIQRQGVFGVVLFIIIICILEKAGKYELYT